MRCTRAAGGVMAALVLRLFAAGSLDRAPPDPNPFKGVDFLRAPKYTEGVQRSVQQAGGLDTEVGKLVARAARIPTAVWLDKISELPRAEEALDLATEQQSRTGRPVLVVFVVYNLPGRDCSARSSNGELSATDGLPAYEKRYLQPLLSILRKYPSPRIVFLIEPDSLPNLVTNMWSPKCAASRSTYIEGVARAAEVLSDFGTVYLDVGWSGWIGSWSASKMAKVVDSVLNRMPEEAIARVRGIVTDISNYGTVFQEVQYANTMLREMAQLGRAGWHAVIDTGRDAIDMGGQIWCNANGAGAGRTATAETGHELVDAYFWIKPPGESDGISDPTSSRYDPECGKASAMRDAPNAGEWFHDQFVMLMQNAKPSLDAAPSYEPRVMPSVPTSSDADAAGAPPPPSPLPVGAESGDLVTQEGDFAFSYDDSADDAAEANAEVEAPASVVNLDQPGKQPATTSTGTSAAGRPAAPAGSPSQGHATVPTGARIGRRVPPPPPAAPVPTISAAQLVKLAGIVVAALVLICLLRNASPPREEPETPSRRVSKRKLRSQRVRVRGDEHELSPVIRSP